MQGTRDRHTIGIRVVQEAEISVERYRTEESTTIIHTSGSAQRLRHNEHGGVVGALLVGTATAIFGLADIITVSIVLTTPRLVIAPVVEFIGVLTGITALGAFGTWYLSRQDDDRSHMIRPRESEILATVKDKSMARSLYDSILASEKDFKALWGQEELLNQDRPEHLDQLAIAVVIAQRWLDGGAVDKALQELNEKTRDFIDAQIALAGRLEGRPSVEKHIIPAHAVTIPVYERQVDTLYELELASYRARATSWNMANLTGDALGPRPVRPPEPPGEWRTKTYEVGPETNYEKTYIEERARSLRKAARGVQLNYIERFGLGKPDGIKKA